MLYIRVIKTLSVANAVQIVYYRNSKRIIYKHIGSAKTDKELEKDVSLAYRPQSFLNEVKRK